MRRVYCIIIAVFLWLPTLVAKEIPCDTETHPLVCNFLNRYLNEALQWNAKEPTLAQKMQDDKFLVLEGNLSNIYLFDSTTTMSLHRYENRAYEAEWSSHGEILLRVAFPIQYELILGRTQKELEPELKNYITQSKQIKQFEIPTLNATPNEQGIYYSQPQANYQIAELTNCSYYYLRNDSLRPVMDSDFVVYSLSNLFQIPIQGKDMCIRVQQSVYGFQQLEYTIQLSQWQNYCRNEELTQYVAIEESLDEAWKVLIVAESKDLAYNHILSVLVPKTIFSDRKTTLYAKINAFIPTHNLKELYQQNSSTKKHTYE